MIDELRTKKGLFISIMIFSLFEMIFVTSGAVGPNQKEEKFSGQIIKFLEEDSDSDESLKDLDLRFTEEEETQTETEGGTIKITIVDTLSEDVPLFSSDVWSTIQSNVYIKIDGEFIAISAEVPKIPKSAAGKNVEILFKNPPKSLSYIFANHTDMEVVDLSYLNVSQLTTMEGMCKGSTKIKEVNLNKLKANKLTNMKEVFSGCTSLTIVEMTGFISENVETMESTFYGCSSLKNLDLSSLKTKKVTSCKNMFSGCINLETIDLSGFELDDSVNIEGIIDNCNSLKEVTLNQKKNKRLAELLKAKGVKIIDPDPDPKEEDKVEFNPFHKKSSGGLSGGAIAAVVVVCVAVVIIVVVIIFVVKAKVATTAGSVAVATASTVMSGTT